MLTHWGVIEADWDAIYHRDLADDVYQRRKTWRWVHTRLLGLLGCDTATARLYAADHHVSTPTRNAQTARKPLTPQGVGNLLAAWAEPGKA